MSRLPRLLRLPRLPRAKRGGAKRGGGGATRGEFVLAVCGPSSAVHSQGLLRCLQRLAMTGR